jgi:UPF0716 protein FxsA
VAQHEKRVVSAVSRFRTLLPLLVAAWVVLEIWLLIQVGEAIGGLAVFGLLLVAALAGGWLIKDAGLRALREAARSVQGRPAESPKGDGSVGASLAAGVLLIIPGLLSDVLALACLFPPTRRLLRRVPERLARGGSRGPLSDAYRFQEQMRMHRPDGKVVHGEVVDPQPYDYSAGDGGAERGRLPG